MGGPEAVEKMHEDSQGLLFIFLACRSCVWKSLAWGRMRRRIARVYLFLSWLQELRFEKPDAVVENALRRARG